MKVREMIEQIEGGTRIKVKNPINGTGLEDDVIYIGKAEKVPQYVKDMEVYCILPHQEGYIGGNTVIVYKAE